MMRLFLDANVLFSVAYREGNRVELLFALAKVKRCTLLTSPFAAEEALRNITAKKPDRVQALAKLLQQTASAPEPPAASVADALKHRLPPKDAPILAAAIHAKADALVTGDLAHFGHLFGTRIGGTAVLTVAQTLEQLANQ